MQAYKPKTSKDLFRIDELYSKEHQEFIRTELEEVLNFFEYGTFEEEPKYLKMGPKNSYGTTMKSHNEKALKEAVTISKEELKKKKVIINQEKDNV